MKKQEQQEQNLTEVMIDKKEKKTPLPLILDSPSFLISPLLLEF